MKACKRFHFEDVEEGDILVLESEDGVKATVKVSKKWSTETFGEVVMSASGMTFYLRDYDTIKAVSQ